MRHDYNYANEIFQSLATNGETYLRIYKLLLDHYYECRQYEEGIAFYEKFYNSFPLQASSSEFLVSYVKLLCGRGDFQKAKQQASLIINASTRTPKKHELESATTAFNSIIHHLDLFSLPHLFDSVLDYMKSNGIPANQYTYIPITSYYGRTKQYEKAFRVFKDFRMQFGNDVSNAHLISTLYRYYLKSQYPDVFEGIGNVESHDYVHEMRDDYMKRPVYSSEVLQKWSLILVSSIEALKNGTVHPKSTITLPDVLETVPAAQETAQESEKSGELNPKDDYSKVLTMTEITHQEGISQTKTKAIPVMSKVFESFINMLGYSSTSGIDFLSILIPFHCTRASLPSCTRSKVLTRYHDNHAFAAEELYFLKIDQTEGCSTYQQWMIRMYTKRGEVTKRKALDMLMETI